jgi:hypothetical protein
LLAKLPSAKEIIALRPAKELQQRVNQLLEKHGGLTQTTNLALACAICNKYITSIKAVILPRLILRPMNWLDFIRAVMCGRSTLLYQLAK